MFRLNGTDYVNVEDIQKFRIIQEDGERGCLEVTVNKDRHYVYPLSETQDIFDFAEKFARRIIEAKLSLRLNCQCKQ